MRRGRRIQRVSRTRHAVWAVVLLTLCALATPAAIFYPNILQTVSPKAYASYACERTIKTASREAEKLRTAWGLSVWETLLSEPSYIAADVTLTTMEDDLADRPPFPEGLRWRCEVWRDVAAGALSARQSLDWGQKTFFMEGRLTDGALTVVAPQLYARPLSFTPERLGGEWNESFLSEIAALPDGLSLTAPESTEPGGENLLETLSAAFREAMSHAVPSSESNAADGRLYVFSLPEADGRRMLDAVLASCRSQTDVLRLLSDFDETWEALFDEGDLPFGVCEISLSTDGAHRLRETTLSLTSQGEGAGDGLSLSVGLDGSPSPADRLTVSIRRERAGQPQAMLWLEADRLVTPNASGRMEADVALSYSCGPVAHKAALNLSLDLNAATDGLCLAASWDGVRAELAGGYAVDGASGQVSLHADRLVFGDDGNTFVLEGDMRCDWRRADAGTPQAPPIPDDPQRIDSLDRFEQAALLESFYRLFYYD